MPAYWLARATIKDPAAYKKYTDRVPAVLAAYGGRILARGGRFEIVEGQTPHERFVVVEFDSVDMAVACHSSAAYKEAAAFRRSGGGDVEIVIVEGAPSSG